MNTSTLEMGIGAQSQNRTRQAIEMLKEFADFTLRSTTARKIRSSEVSSVKAPCYQIGEAVQHAGYGTGQVIGHWPDGRLQIRFDNMVKSQLVFPTLVNCVNGHRL